MYKVLLEKLTENIEIAANWKAFVSRGITLSDFKSFSVRVLFKHTIYNSQLHNYNIYT